MTFDTVKNIFLCVFIIYVTFLLFVFTNGCVSVGTRYRVNVNSNSELDAYPGYEYQLGNKYLYGTYRKAEYRIRWGGQHGGLLSSDVFGIRFRYPFEKERLSFSPWIQLEAYNIDADLEHGTWTKKRKGSHREALMRKQNEMVNHTGDLVRFDNYRLDIDNMYGVSLGFDVGYEVYPHVTLELGAGYSAAQAQYHIHGWHNDKPHYWDSREHLDLSQYFGTIGFRISF